jgi:hypothetical integral membrane protein (TIGR02206 family)
MAITPELHLGMFVVVSILVAVSLYSAKLFEKRGRLQINTGFQALGMIVLWLAYNVYYLVPSRFTWDNSLPLHVCDILAPTAALAIGTSNRYARALLYFCGITLAGQAIMTPTGDQNPSGVRFWLYWLLHASIIALSILDIVVIRYRPTLEDYLRVLKVDLAYIMLVAPLDAIFGWRYGYLGRELPSAATALNYLGPWPWRIASMLLVVALIQLLTLIPWLIMAKYNRKTSI